MAEDNSELGGGGYCQFRIQGGGGVSKYSKLGVVGFSNKRNIKYKIEGEFPLG